MLLQDDAPTLEMVYPAPDLLAFPSDSLALADDLTADDQAHEDDLPLIIEELIIEEISIDGMCGVY